MTSKKTFEPDWVSPPGDTIQDAIDEIGVSRAKLAQGLHLTLEQVDQLIIGEAKLTPAIAEKLEQILGESAQF